MANPPKTKGFEKLSDPEKYLVIGPGGAKPLTRLKVRLSESDA